MKNEIEIQREYYKRTASLYDGMHVHGDGEHDLACAIVSSLSKYYKYQSILDCGSGTGRAVTQLSNSLPECQIVGVEPVENLRKAGHANGIPEQQLIEGDATNLTFQDSSFDLVTELSILHHIRQPRLAVTEMLRVAKKAIFISDSNRFGQGSLPGRLLKLSLYKLGLWPFANWVNTRGRVYNYSEGDGLAYSYSVFDDYDFICSQCDQVIVFNLDGTGKSALLGAPHVGLFGRKKKIC